MARPALRNASGRLQLLQRAVFDDYDFGLKMPYLEGANRLLTSRGGSFIRRGEHPLSAYWRLPQRRLLEDLDVLFPRAQRMTTEVNACLSSQSKNE